MGNKNPKPHVISGVDLDNKVPSQQDQTQTFAQQIIQETFKNSAYNGFLNKDRFNEALSCLENFNIKRLRDTPLADRLFTIFDEDKNGTISYEEFVKGLTTLLSERESRIMCNKIEMSYYERPPEKNLQPP